MAKKRVLFSREELQERIRDLGKEITRDYEGKDLICIGLLRGGFIFLADIVREIPLEMDIDFMRTASYGKGEKSTGLVKILENHRSSIEGKDVLVVDDIIDSGHTIATVVDLLKKERPKSIKTCLMLDKPSRREVDFKPDYVAFEIPDVFIVGCGLNYGDYERNVPYIYTYDD